MTSDVVASYHRALADRDFEAARMMLKDDLHFRGPFDEFHRADDYVNALRGLWNIVKAVDRKHLSADGDEAVVPFEMATTTPAGTQLVCKWYGVDGERIAWIRAVFDTAPFAFLRRAE
jgi:hypothetical protein